MEKISANKAWQVYSEVPGVLRALVSERDELKEKLASADARIAEFEERDRIEKIARRMEEKKISYGDDFSDTCDRIKEAASQGKSLDAIEEAVEMTAPDGSIAKLGSDEEHGQGDNALEAYLLGGLE
jgi:predicted nuclease with TOPRIM domain